ncbi:hypothetical protein Ruko_14140 [Ruthenibacterium sp. TH_2024_36131]|uniref:CotH kinase family protein n=1 Tax=Owariibacterium komagatae TaxID=3136601 RepID=UPI0038B2E791
MNKFERRNAGILVSVVLAAAVLLAVLYVKNQIPVEKVPETQPSSLEDWTLEDSALNGVPLEEDKGIYEQNNNIYDVYISVFPTKDSDGNMLDFSAFDKHTSRDHTYNPTLNCNIQILNEGETLDPLMSLDQKNATIRVRGNSSRGDKYKSYKVKLDEEAETFFGQSNLNINKHSEDITKIATKLETDLLTQIPDILSYRTYFMRVWIRDTSVPQDQQEFKYYGLFTQIEQPNKTYLELRGLSSNGSMYKARDFSFALSDVLKDVDDPGYDEEAFETVLAIREAEDHEKLLEMLQAVNDETTDFEEVFYTYFNEENYLTWLAFNLLMGNNDIINHNFIIYNPDNSQTWYFVPWDFDGTLRFGEYESSLMKLPVSLRGVQKLNQSVLHRRYLRLDGSIEKIEQKMQELLQNYITRDRVTELVNSYKPILEKTLPLAPDIELLDMTPSEMPAYLDSLYDGILSNYEMFEQSMQYPTPMYVAKPVRNAAGGVDFAWETSYSYQGRPVTYNLQVFTDYNMQNMIFEATDLVQTTFTKEDGLEPGTYYLKVTAVDSEGHEQLSMERFETMLTDIKGYNVNGLLEFVIE